MREKLTLSDGWQFSLGDDTFEEMLNNKNRHTVTIPHTWNNLDGQDGGDNYRRCKGWYQRTINIEKDNSKEYWIEFLGVNSVADVYLNAVHLGQHRGGYTLFRFNMTQALNDGENILTVCADNSPFADVIPLTADFTFFGGIYREVNLITVDKTHFALDVFGSDGVDIFYDNSPKVRQCADLKINYCVSNAIQNCRIETQIVIPNNFSKCEGIENPVFSIKNMISTSEETVAKRTSQVLSSNTSAVLKIENPHLWNGKTDPFRYKVICTLYNGDTPIDYVEKHIGIRYFSIHPRKGFFLNGASYPLRGVNRHQDRENMGWAITNREHDEDFSLIYEIGANAIRLAHYPHHPHFYDLCDQYGLLVWAEIPFVENIGGLKISKLPTDNKIDPHITKNLLENAKQQMSELILQQRHRPSIFCWSMSNEILREYKKTAADLINELNGLVHRLDPSRYSAMAVNHTYAYRWKSDIKGCNIYPGWYFGKESQFSSQMRYNMSANRMKGVAASEYGAGSNVLQHCENPVQPKDTTCDFHPEEWASIVHENALKYFMSPKAKKVWGSFVWNMFDFAVDNRNEGKLPGKNDKGLVTYDRKIKKDAFFIYKAYWSKEPVVYITSRRFTVRQSAKIFVKVYSNSKFITLSVNKRIFGKLSNSDNNQKNVFIFDNIVLNSGKNIITATDENGICDTVVWEYYPNNA